MNSFNLIDRPWIPCRFLDQSCPVELGLQETLVRASEIREIESNSPIVTASLHRLLLVILHRHFERGCGPVSVEEWADLWKQGHFDGTRLATYLDQWRDRFDLFHSERPFYQCASLKSEYARPVSTLSPERASGNNATLFDHTTEQGEPSLSPAVVARALVALQAFAVGGLVSLEKGQDPKKYKSAQGAPLVKSALALVSGSSLFETLLLNLHRFNKSEQTPFRSGPPDQPAWERAEQPGVGERYPEGPLDYLTWQSRRVLLLAETQADAEPTVTRAIVMKGEALPQDWQQEGRETMVAYRKNPPQAKLDSAPWTPVTFQTERSVWRDSLALLQSVGGRQSRPMTFEWLGHLSAAGVLPPTSRFQVQLLGLSTDRARVLLWRHERMPLPLAYLREEGLVEKLTWALDITEKGANELRSGAQALALNLLSPEMADSRPRGRPDKNRLRQLA